MRKVWDSVHSPEEHTRIRSDRDLFHADVYADRLGGRVGDVPSVGSYRRHILFLDRRAGIGVRLLPATFDDLARRHVAIRVDEEADDLPANQDIPKLDWRSRASADGEALLN